MALAEKEEVLLHKAERFGLLTLHLGHHSKVLRCQVVEDGVIDVPSCVLEQAFQTLCGRGI